MWPSNQHHDHWLDPEKLCFNTGAVVDYALNSEFEAATLSHHGAAADESDWLGLWLPENNVA